MDRPARLPRGPRVRSQPAREPRGDAPQEEEAGPVLSARSAATLEAIEGLRDEVASLARGLDDAEAHLAASELVELVLFGLASEALGVEPAGRLVGFARRSRPAPALASHLRVLSARVGDDALDPLARLALPVSALCDVVERLGALELADVVPEDLGLWHVHLLDDPDLHSSYYTPAWLARELAQRALAGSPDEPRVLDPACGGGALLLASLRALEAARVEALSTSARRALRDGVLERHGDALVLGVEEHARLVRACIRGIDVDAGAVRCARRALALEVLGGRPGELQLELVHDGLGLGECVVAADGLGDDPWGAEVFDAIVANPPYAELDDASLRARFASATYKLDAYPMFIERALELVRPGGRAALLTPNSFLTNTHAEALRRLVLERARVLTVDVLARNPFQGVSVDLVVTTLAREAPEPVPDDHVVTTRTLFVGGRREPLAAIPQRLWADDERALFDVTSDILDRERLGAMERSGRTLGDVADAYFGLQTMSRDAFVVDGDDPGRDWAPCIDGAHVQRFHLGASTEWVCTLPEAIKSGGDARVHGRERVVVRQIGRRPICAIAPADTWALNTIYNVWPREGSGYSNLHLLGLLMSEPMGFYWERRFWDAKRTFPKIKKASLLALPLPLETPANRARLDALAAAVSAIVDARAAAAAAHDPDDHDAAIERARAHERELDALVEAMFA